MDNQGSWSVQIHLAGSRQIELCSWSHALYIDSAPHHQKTDGRIPARRQGKAKVSYNKLATATGISRAKIASGIGILINYGLIGKTNYKKTNVYSLTNYETQGGWAKLPCKSLYDKELERIVPFKEFKLRQKNELHALKLYLLLIALRSNQNNHASPSYERIQFYTGISRNDIRSAISLLINLGMIHVQRLGDPSEEGRVRNLYRILGIENHRHLGNIGRDWVEQDTERSM